MQTTAFRKQLGEEVRRWRERKRLTQSQLAQLAGLHLNSIHRYEKAQADMPVTTLAGICAVLGINMTTLLHPLRTKRRVTLTKKGKNQPK